MNEYIDLCHRFLSTDRNLNHAICSPSEMIVLLTPAACPFVKLPPVIIYTVIVPEVLTLNIPPITSVLLLIIIQGKLRLIAGLNRAGIALVEVK